ncbi:ABC transporter substrate-binding protein [Neobacillus sp. NPDC097160]|uniref:ABC transporter substrate-binding protein n=1 Tax=Neobacillus sp. NPDC097160 TaxID=3364298 RepID=UPI00381CCC33
MSELITDFMEVRDFYKDEQDNKPFHVTMDELSSILFCTARNTKFILNKMINEGWISFIPGQGRGKKSTLIFLKAKDEILFDEGIKQIEEGYITAALNLISRYGSPPLQKKILLWLSEFFGYEKQGTGPDFTEIIRFPVFRTINALMPDEAFFDFDAHLVKQIFNTLVTYDQIQNRVNGSLAHYWEANADKTVWTFFLKKGVLFHHGKEMEASDVQYTFQRLHRHDYEQSWLVSNIKEIQVIDKYTVRFNLESTNELFLQFLSFPSLSVVPTDMVNDEKLPIGTGPFRVANYHPNQCILEANPSYFEGRAFIDRIEITNMPKVFLSESKDEHNIFLNTGDHDSYSKKPAWEEMKDTYAGSTLITFNLNKPGRPQINKKFRQVMDQLINRDNMISVLGSPRKHPSYGFEHKHSQPLKKAVNSPSEIQALITQTGYDGEPIQLFTYDRHEKDALWIKQECAQYGFHVSVSIVGWKEILNQAVIHQADCILFEAVWGENELSKIELYQSGFSFLRNHLDKASVQAIDEIIEKILKERDPIKRDQLFDLAEELIKAETLVSFLVHKDIDTTFHPSIRGVKFNPRGNIDFKDLWIKPI